MTVTNTLAYYGTATIMTANFEIADSGKEKGGGREKIKKKVKHENVISIWAEWLSNFLIQ